MWWSKENVVVKREHCGQKRTRWSKENTVVKREHGGQKRMWWSKENAVVKRECGGQKRMRWSKENTVVKRERGGQKRMWWSKENVVVKRECSGQKRMWWSKENAVVKRECDGRKRTWWSKENAVTKENTMQNNAATRSGTIYPHALRQFKMVKELAEIQILHPLFENTLRMMELHFYYHAHNIFSSQYIKSLLSPLLNINLTIMYAIDWKQSTVILRFCTPYNL